MILGTGIDAVDIARFKPWATYPHTRLQRIFSDTEIEYCLSVPIKTAERFAVRFAAREAFLKALSAAQPTVDVPLLTICKAVQVERLPNGAPHLHITWDKLIPYVSPQILRCQVHCSLTHTKTTATAWVILEK